MTDMHTGDTVPVAYRPNTEVEADAPKEDAVMDLHDDDIGSEMPRDVEAGRGSQSYTRSKQD